MRNNLVAIVTAALLGAACDGKTSPPSAPAAEASPPAAPAPGSAAAATAPETPNPVRHKSKKATRVARRTHGATKVRKGGERKVEQADAGDPRAPTLRLNQSPPSSY